MCNCDSSVCWAEAYPCVPWCSRAVRSSRVAAPRAARPPSSAKGRPAPTRCSPVGQRPATLLMRPSTRSFAMSRRRSPSWGASSFLCLPDPTSELRKRCANSNNNRAPTALMLPAYPHAAVNWDGEEGHCAPARRTSGRVLINTEPPVACVSSGSPACV